MTPSAIQICGNFEKSKLGVGDRFVVEYTLALIAKEAARCPKVERIIRIESMEDIEKVMKKSEGDASFIPVTSRSRSTLETLGGALFVVLILSTIFRGGILQ